MSTTSSLKLVVLYYGFYLKTGGTYVTINTYINYLKSKGHQVFLFDRYVPSTEQIKNIKPDCIISAQFANLDVNRFIYVWNVPLIVLTFGLQQYTINKDKKYPSLVTYSNSFLRNSDINQTKAAIIRDPVNHIIYEIPAIKKNPKYITLIGDPANVKGHNLFIELARRLPLLDFMLVTKHQYTGLPSNIYIQGYILDIETLKNNVYAKTKVLLLPSIYEAFGRVTIEATASNIPCIISDYPGLSEATFNMSNYISPRRDVDKWEQELTRVLTNYNAEVQKANNIRLKLDYDRDLSYFESLIFDTISKFNLNLI